MNVIVEQAGAAPGPLSPARPAPTQAPRAGDLDEPTLAAGGALVLVLRGQRFLYTLSPAPLRLLAYTVLPLALYLPALVLLGMEHTLHALLAVALLLMLARALRRPLTRRELAGLAALSLVAGAIRYETLFLAGGAAVALVLVPREDFVHGPLAPLPPPAGGAVLLPPPAAASARRCWPPWCSPACPPSSSATRPASPTRRTASTCTSTSSAASSPPRTPVARCWSTTSAR